MADPRVTLQLLQLLQQGAVRVGPPSSITNTVSGNSVYNTTSSPPSTATVLPITVAPTVTISTAAPPSLVTSLASCPQTGFASHQPSMHQPRQQPVSY